VNTSIVAQVLRVVVFGILLWGCASGDERKRDYLESAQNHFDNGDMEKAAVDVRNSLQIDEEFLDARFLYAQILENGQDWQQVVANLKFIIDRDENHAEARVTLGTIFLASGAFEDAKSEADAVILSDPENAEAHALLAAVYFRQGQTEDAIDTAERALSFETGNISAIAVLTEIYKTENPLLALETIQQGIAAQDNQAVFRMMQISVHEAEKNYDNVIEIYQGLIDEEPDNLYYYNRYVSVLERQGEHARAIELLDGLVETRPDEVELKLWLVRYLVTHRDLPTAEAALREFLEVSPAEPDLSLGLGEVLVAQQRTEEAREHYRAMASDGESTESAQSGRLALFRLEVGEGKDDAAEAVLQELLEIEPENPDGLLVRASQALSAQDFGEAVVKSRAVLRSRPDSVPALQVLAAAHVGAGTPNLALDNYRQILEIDGNNVSALVQLSKHAAQQGELEQAEQLATAAIRLAPENTEAARVLVGVFAERGDIDSAIGQADELSKSEAGGLLGTFLLGRIHQVDKDYEQAVVKYREVLGLRPDVRDALAGLVASYLELDQLEEAKAYLVEFIDAHPEVAHAKPMLARFEINEQDLAGAQQLLESAATDSPSSVESHVMLGDLLVQQNKNDEARVAYQRGLDSNPSNAGLLIRVAQMAELEKDFDVAIELYEQALALNENLLIARNNVSVLYADHRPTEENLRRAISLMRGYANSKEAALLDTLGWVYYKLDDVDQAVRYLEAAVEAGLDDPTLEYHLGMAYIKAGEAQAARKSLERALSENSDHEWRVEAQTALSGIEA